MTVRHYSSAAGKMILQVGVNAIATALQVDTTAGLPGATPFSLLVDVGLPTEEIVTVTQVSGNSLVVVRGEDGTSAQPHASGAVIRHGITARDFRDSRDHENASGGVHGLSGTVVGTTDTQTLTNKNLSSATNVFPSSLATDAELATETAARLAHQNATAAHGVLGSVVGTTDTQTLSGKTLVGSVVTPATTASNAQVIQGLPAQAGVLSIWKNSAGTNLAFVDSAGNFSNSLSASAGCILYGSEGTPSSSQAYIGGKDPTKFVLNLNGPTGQSFDLLRMAVNGVRVAGFQADGTLDAPNIPTSIPATSAAKAGKRAVPITSTVTPDGTGYATVTHGLGFTPAVVVGTPEFAYSVGVDTRTSTTFRVRLLNPVTGAPATGATLVMFVCWE